MTNILSAVIEMGRKAGEAARSRAMPTRLWTPPDFWTNMIAEAGGDTDVMDSTEIDGLANVWWEAYRDACETSPTVIGGRVHDIWLTKEGNGYSYTVKDVAGSVVGQGWSAGTKEEAHHEAVEFMRSRSSRGG